MGSLVGLQRPLAHTPQLWLAGSQRTMPHHPVLMHLRKLSHLALCLMPTSEVQGVALAGMPNGSECTEYMCSMLIKARCVHLALPLH